MIHWTNDDLREECAYYGFLACPLTDAQMDRLRAQGHSLTSAYGVACDVNAGFDFDITARANVTGPNADTAAE